MIKSVRIKQNTAYIAKRCPLFTTIIKSCLLKEGMTPKGRKYFSTDGINDCFNGKVYKAGFFKMMGNTIYTIGHSNHTAEDFLKLLNQHNISAVADVRSSPYSRRNPQFKYKALAKLLHDNSIAYIYLGKELGARPEDPYCYIDGRVSFKLLAEASLFKHGIDRLVKGAETYKIAIMCAEKEPLACHRTILVSQYLVKCGLNVYHILANGQLESHAQTTQRLLDQLGMQNNELFRSRDEVIDEAFAKREQEIAYTK